MKTSEVYLSMIVLSILEYAEKLYNMLCRINFSCIRKSHDFIKFGQNKKKL